MSKIKTSLLALTILTSSILCAEEAKKEEPKKEEVKKEEPKKEEPKKEEPKKEEVKKEEVKKEEVKKPVVIAKPTACFYQAGSLVGIDNQKFDNEVKKIQDVFEKCEQNLAKEKEQEAKAKECKTLGVELRSKKMALIKLTSESATINKKEEFEKLVASVKVAKDELSLLQTGFKEKCHIEVKKEEPKKEEPKKEEPKKEEPKKEEPKKEEHK